MADKKTRTPGPWTDVHNVSHERTVRSSNPDTDNGGFIIATCCGPNARMISATPRMLEELEEILSWAILERAPLRQQEIDSIRAAIAKARF